MGQLDSTYGAMLIGIFLSAILFGVTNLQMFIYFQRCSRDIIWNKLAVCWLWLLDALHLAFCLHMVYWYFIINYDNPEELLYIVWSFKGQIILDSIVVISVHTLYVIRIWKLNAIVSRRRPGLRHKILPCSLSVVMLAGFGELVQEQRLHDTSVRIDLCNR
ncbi:hypothetical protein AcW1_001605 [Taiwanofungus camphoratus]|nr:hypothetical protein AcW1_001605 [Antrodia cinnamomea]